MTPITIQGLVGGSLMTNAMKGVLIRAGTDLKLEIE